MENSFSRYSWRTASRKPHLTFLNRIDFNRKQNPFVDFAVVKFAYALSEPYRPKRLSIAILALALALALVPAAPELGEPD